MKYEILSQMLAPCRIHPRGIGGAGTGGGGALANALIACTGTNLIVKRVPFPDLLLMMSINPNHVPGTFISVVLD